MTANLATLESPVLILRGEESELLTREGAQALTDELQDARVVEVARAGHHVHIDQPERTLAALQEFLEEAADPQFTPLADASQRSTAGTK